MALVVAVGILTLELVYRLVALPLDYRPDRHEAALPDPPPAVTGEIVTGDAPTTAEPVLPETSLSLDRRLELPSQRPLRRIDAATKTLAGADPTSVALAPADNAAGLRLGRSIDRTPDRAVVALDGEPATVGRDATGATSTAAVEAVPADPVAPVQVNAGTGPAMPVAAKPVLVALPAVPRSLPRGGERPMIAIIIDDMGYSPASLARLAAMSGPLTLAFLPAADATRAMLEAARSREFELMVHLPMEPIGDANPGPEALLVGLGEAELRRRVRWAIERVPGAVGVNNHMGSRFTVNAAALETVMDELRQSRLFFIDSRTNPASMAERVARRFGIPATGRDVFIDHDPSPGAIALQLASIERVAQRHGSVIAIGHPYPTTLAALEAWLPTLAERGFRLVRASEVLAERLCADLAAGGNGCRPALHLAGSDGGPMRLPATEAVP